jgi:hypothetical protein
MKKKKDEIIIGITTAFLLDMARDIIRIEQEDGLKCGEILVIKECDGDDPLIAFKIIPHIERL